MIDTSDDWRYFDRLELSQLLTSSAIAGHLAQVDRPWRRKAALELLSQAREIRLTRGLDRYLP